MSRLISKRSGKAGLPAGSIVHIGEKRAERVRLTLFEYDDAGGEEREIVDVGELPERKRHGVSWIDVEGLHDPAVIEAIGSRFNLHPLILEDVVNTGGRSKVQDCGDYLVVVAKLVHCDEAADHILSEQVSFILGERYLISFQEQPLDIFDAVRERIRAGKGRARKLGADYLLYSLLDEIVDHYFLVIERMGDRVEALEEALADHPTPEILKRIHLLRREMLVLKKAVWPLREVVAEVTRYDGALMQESIDIYLRDVYDHAIQIMDSVETMRDMVSGMMDIYLSSMSNRMNEVMKVLTVIATIFMPITFIAGVFGMNFHYMPELDWRWGYPAALLLMGTVAGGMAIAFKRKRWF